MFKKVWEEAVQPYVLQCAVIFPNFWLSACKL